jgi:carbon storage regulator CsrA
MLVLSRKEQETIRIGKDITITVVKFQGDRVCIGIDAPKDVRIHRGELPPLDAPIQREECDCKEGTNVS